LLEHGGRLREALIRYEIPLAEWLDLSTGINPQGWPVTGQLADSCYRLPEEHDGLECAAADYYGSDQLLPLAGSQAAIQTLPRLRRASHVAVLAPTYAEHAHSWRQAGHEVCELSADQIERCLAQFDIVVVINPNNPTGAVIERGRLLRWRAALARRGGWLLVDEAFIDTTPEQSLLPYLPLPGLIVLRSVGKFFGLPGLRLGFLFAERALRQQLREWLGPWAVSGPARAIGQAALEDRLWQSGARAALQSASQRLARLLSEYGLNPSGGSSLFQWVQGRRAEMLADMLAQRGILVRRFEQPAALRFGLPGSESQWQRLAAALEQIAAQPMVAVEG